jgi:hypothetical protein
MRKREEITKGNHIDFSHSAAVYFKKQKTLTLTLSRSTGRGDKRVTSSLLFTKRQGLIFGGGGLSEAVGDSGAGGEWGGEKEAEGEDDERAG